MGRFVEAADLSQLTLLPECLEDWVGEDNAVQVIDVFVEALDLYRMGFEDIADRSGGEVDDDERHQRVTYSREGARFTFDLEKRRLEIAFGRNSALELVDAAQQFQLGVGRSSPMLAAPSRRSRSADDEA